MGRMREMWGHPSGVSEIQKQHFWAIHRPKVLFLFVISADTSGEVPTRSF